MLWYILIVVILVFGYLKLYKPHQYWKERNVKHIQPLPIVGNMGKMLLRTVPSTEITQSLYNAFDTRYHGTYTFLKPTLILKDIDLIKQIFVKDSENFLDRNVFITEEMEPIFGRSLLFLKGQSWRNMRSTLSPAFTSSKMRSMFILITECAENLSNHYEKNIQPNQTVSVEMRSIASKFTNDVIASCAFGIKCDSFEDPENEFYKVGKDISGFSGKRAIKIIGYLCCPLLMKYFNLKLFSENENNYFRNLVKSMMDIREKEGIIRPDMIHLLMEAKKGKLKHEENVKNSDAGFATVEESNIGTQDQKKIELSDDLLTAQAVLFFSAGFDTSSAVISFMAHELAVNEEIQRNLQDEIDEILTNHNGKVSYETILKMKYLDMVVSETLRKWPPIVSTDRVCRKPYVIDPVEPDESPLVIEKDMFVCVIIYAMHRDPKYFPDPDRFDPERFNDENKKNITPFSYLPFGIGPRNCIASRFALLEIKAMFFYMLAKFDLVVVKETQIPLKLDKKSFLLNAEKGYWVGLKKRSK